MHMNAGQFKKSLKGIVPVQICPYTQKGGVDYEGLKINTEFIVDFAKEGNKDVDIKLSIKGQGLIVKSLEDLDKKEQLDTHQYLVFKKIKKQEKE